jgi:very-short-patch-repair endonuclease
MTTSPDQIFSRKSLLAFGMTRHSIARAVARGDLVHIRRGWYASPTAAIDAVRAVRVGGVATALSATRLWGIWTPPDDTLHVAVPGNASRLRHPARSVTLAGEPGLCLHWRGHTGGRSGVASVIDALMDAVQCQPEERAVVVIDSALNAGLVSLRQLERAFAHAPRRYARALNHADARSQSGIETLVRLRLRARGIRVSVQVRITGVGHVDLLVGDRFVIECDSKAWHSGDDRYFEDRRRDRKLIGLDYLPMRITYEMVVFDWAETERVILRRVAQRDHLWPRRSESGKTASRRAKTHDEDGFS